MLFLRKRIGHRDPVPGESFLQIFRKKQPASRHSGGAEDYGSGFRFGPDEALAGVLARHESDTDAAPPDGGG